MKCDLPGTLPADWGQLRDLQVSLMCASRVHASTHSVPASWTNNLHAATTPGDPAILLKGRPVPSAAQHNRDHSAGVGEAGQAQEAPPGVSGGRGGPGGRSFLLLSVLHSCTQSHTPLYSVPSPQYPTHTLSAPTSPHPPSPCRFSAPCAGPQPDAPLGSPSSGRRLAGAEGAGPLRKPLDRDAAAALARCDAPVAKAQPQASAAAVSNVPSLLAAHARRRLVSSCQIRLCWSNIAETDSQTSPDRQTRPSWSNPRPCCQLPFRTNNLTGPLPVDMGEWRQMEELELQWNNFTGRLRWVRARLLRCVGTGHAHPSSAA